MTRIFATLAVLGNLGLAIIFGLGWVIGDNPLSVEVRAQMATHFRAALIMIPVTMLVHSIAFTYFMGTGRWIEETCEAYKLGPDFRARNIQLKYRIIPGMMLCFGLMLVTGAFGALSDPASSTRMDSAKSIHFVLAITTLLANLLVTWIEWRTIDQNGRLVDAVMEEVRRMRRERGLDN